MEQKNILTADDLVIGGKYVPHQKTHGLLGLHNSDEWQQCLRSNQQFLFYLGYAYGGHMFGYKYDGKNGGDFFHPQDVTPYIEPTEEVNKPIIDITAAAENYIRQPHYDDNGHKGSFIAGANWQKEQTKALQEENEQLRKMHNIALDKYQSLQESSTKILAQLKVALQYMEVFMVRGEEPLPDDNLKTDLYNVRHIIEQCEKNM